MVEKKEEEKQRGKRGKASEISEEGERNLAFILKKIFFFLFFKRHLPRVLF